MDMSISLEYRTRRKSLASNITVFNIWDLYNNRYGQYCETAMLCKHRKKEADTDFCR